MPVMSKQQVVLQITREKLPLMKEGTCYSYFKIIQGMILIVISRVATEYFPKAYYCK